MIQENLRLSEFEKLKLSRDEIMPERKRLEKLSQALELQKTNLDKKVKHCDSVQQENEKLKIDNEGLNLQLK